MTLLETSDGLLGRVLAELRMGPPSRWIGGAERLMFEGMHAEIRRLRRAAGELFDPPEAPFVGVACANCILPDGHEGGCFPEERARTKTWLSKKGVGGVSVEWRNEQLPIDEAFSLTGLSEQVAYLNGRRVAYVFVADGGPNNKAARYWYYSVPGKSYGFGLPNKDIATWECESAIYHRLSEEVDSAGALERWEAYIKGRTRDVKGGRTDATPMPAVPAPATGETASPKSPSAEQLPVEQGSLRWRVCRSGPGRTISRFECHTGGRVLGSVVAIWEGFEVRTETFAPFVEDMEGLPVTGLSEAMRLVERWLNDRDQLRLMAKQASISTGEPQWLTLVRRWEYYAAGKLFGVVAWRGATTDPYGEVKTPAEGIPENWMAQTYGTKEAPGSCMYFGKSGQLSAVDARRWVEDRYAITASKMPGPTEAKAEASPEVAEAALALETRVEDAGGAPVPTVDGVKEEAPAAPEQPPARGLRGARWVSCWSSNTRAIHAWSYVVGDDVLGGVRQRRRGEWGLQNRYVPFVRQTEFEEVNGLHNAMRFLEAKVKDEVTAREATTLEPSVWELNGPQWFLPRVREDESEVWRCAGYGEIFAEVVRTVLADGVVRAVAVGDEVVPPGSWVVRLLTTRAFSGVPLPAESTRVFEHCARAAAWVETCWYSMDHASAERTRRVERMLAERAACVVGVPEVEPPGATTAPSVTAPSILWRWISEKNDDRAWSKAEYVRRVELHKDGAWVRYAHVSIHEHDGSTWTVHVTGDPPAGGTTWHRARTYAEDVLRRMGVIAERDPVPHAKPPGTYDE